MSSDSTWVLDGPVKLDRSKRNVAIQEVESWLVPGSNGDVDPDTTFDELEDMTIPQFVDWFYGYWRRVKKGNVVDGHARSVVSRSRVDLVRAAEDYMLLSTLNMTLELW